MAMGMSVSEYWDGEAELCRYYRKAEEIRLKKRNYEMWLQGAYVYNTMLAVYPVYHSFIKNPKPSPYLDFPFPLTEKEAAEQHRIKEQRKAELFKERVLAWAAQVNERFKEQDDAGSRSEQNQDNN